MALSPLLPLLGPLPWAELPAQLPPGLLAFHSCLSVLWKLLWLLDQGLHLSHFLPPHLAAVPILLRAFARAVPPSGMLFPKMSGSLASLKPFSNINLWSFLTTSPPHPCFPLQKHLGRGCGPSPSVLSQPCSHRGRWLLPLRSSDWAQGHPLHPPLAKQPSVHRGMTEDTGARAEPLGTLTANVRMCWVRVQLEGGKDTCHHVTWRRWGW